VYTGQWYRIRLRKSVIHRLNCAHCHLAECRHPTFGQEVRCHTAKLERNGRVIIVRDPCERHGVVSTSFFFCHRHVARKFRCESEVAYSGKLSWRVYEEMSNHVSFCLYWTVLKTISHKVTSLTCVKYARKRVV